MVLCFARDLCESDDNNNNDGDGAHRRRCLAQAAWLQAFWLPIQQRKNPAYTLSLEETVFRCHCSSFDKDPAAATTQEALREASSVMPDWNKLLQAALKKIQVEDLGDLAAPELWACIPADKEGRGRQDLERMERKLSVKVLFLDQEHGNRVLLVGSKPKLEKKCLAIRNMLSHYYWRLKGKQVFL